MAERRKTRTLFKDVALRSWLSAVAQRNQVGALTVADNSGLQIAVGEQDPLIEEMAAISAQQAPSLGNEAVVDFHGQCMSVRAMCWRDEILYVSALGEAGRGKAAVAEAVDGIARILE